MMLMDFSPVVKRGRTMSVYTEIMAGLNFQVV